jgi:hypothetical protein
MTDKNQQNLPGEQPYVDTFETENFETAARDAAPIETSNLPATTDKPQPPKKKGKEASPQVKGSFAGGTWIALIAGALLLILLLVFILQNQQPAEMTLFSWQFTFPTGVGLLLAAIAGALIMALVGGVRMIQLRRQIKKTQKAAATRK